MIDELTPARCQAILEDLGLALSDAEAETLRQLAAGGLHATALLDLLPLQDPPPRYPRSGWHRPPASENPLGAWQTRGVLKGAPGGRLAGKRIAIKDNLLLAGVPLANGTRVLGDYTPTRDAEIVNRMLDAGAEIIGKTVCEAYCFSGGSHTAASGAVRNPHDPTRSAGGSSSGSGVVVASGEADMAIGCDQGGSIRMPSSFCGIVGMKPSWGVVPYTGILGMSFTIDHAGPMTRTVADNALLLEVIAGPDGVDPRQHGARWQDYRAALGQPVTGLRIGVLQEGFGRGEADVDECVREAAGRFASLGATVSEVSIPLHAVAGGITFAAMQGMIASMFLLDGACLEHQLEVDPAYVAHQRAWRSRVAELPANLQVILVSAEHLRRQHGYAIFASAMNRVPLIRRAYDAALERVDLLLLPTTPMKAMPLPGADAPAAAVVDAAFAPVANTSVFNHTHHPAISLPCGTRSGLPVGMMLVGRHFEEATLYRAAHAFEQG